MLYSPFVSPWCVSQGENSDIGLNQKVHKQGKIFEQKGSYTHSFKTLASFKEKIEKMLILSTY